MTTEQRLERAEKQIRQLRVLVIGLVVIVGGCFTLGQGKPQAPTATPQAVTIPKVPQVPDVIRAKRFEVVNEGGKRVVSLTSYEHEGTIITFNDKGMPIVMLWATEEGNGAMTTYSGKGKELVPKQA